MIPTDSLRRRTTLVSCLTALLAAGASAGGPQRNPVDAPNIVLVYADDLGWTDLAVMGSRYYETPHIDRLAREGLLFTNAYANAPNCAPSRAALLSGQYAPRTGIYTVASAARGPAERRLLAPVDNKTTLAPSVETLAEVLRDAGYDTGHVGKWHLGGTGALATEQGFGWSIGGDERGSPPTYHYPYRNRTDGRSLPGLEEGPADEYLTDRLIDEAVRFIGRPRTRPFFLYLAHYAPHTPIQPRADLVDRFRDRPPDGGHRSPDYAAMIQSVDDGLDRLLTALEQQGLDERTLVIFHSDNGGFGPVTSMAPLRGSKGMLYEGGIRTPLIVRWPGRIAAGRRSDVPVIGMDLYPTLVEIAGGRLPARQPPDGVSLLPLLTREQQPADRPLFWHFPAYLERDASVPAGEPFRTTPVSAIRQGRYKLLWFFESARAELYDLDTDIGESRDIAAEAPETTASLLAQLQAWWADTGAYLPRARHP
jgi:arylsulfatase A-like enzyme